VIRSALPTTVDGTGPGIASHQVRISTDADGPAGRNASVVSADQAHRPPSGSRAPLRVVIAGGGFAALELLLALRALAEERVSITLLAPSPDFAYRPAATGEPFGAAQVRRFDLAAIAADHGAALRIDALEAVAPTARRLRTAAGAHLDYDALVLALGARRRAAVPGALTFRDQRDSEMIRRIRRALTLGAARSVAFAVPAGTTWALPAYELALLTARHVLTGGLDARVTLATPETTPLEILGPAASGALGTALADLDVRVHLNAAPERFSPGALRLRAGGTVAADEAIALPRLQGVRVSGVPAGWSGFVTTEPDGAIRGVADVYAVGDLTDLPVKQGGLAAQQADAVALTLAARAGAAIAAAPERLVLRARLMGAEQPLFFRVELDARGRPIPSTSEATSGSAPWSPPAKVFARHLAPYLAARGAPSTPTPP
jgi:sulfide:quinone oxidoreductase